MPRMTKCNLLLSLFLNSEGLLHKAEVGLHTVARYLHEIHRDIKINKTLRFLILFCFPARPLCWASAFRRVQVPMWKNCRTEWKSKSAHLKGAARNQ